MDNEQRSRKFGQLLALANIVRERAGVSPLGQDVWDRLRHHPMDTLMRIHEDMIAFLPSLKGDARGLVDLFGDIVDEFQFDEFDNKPLGDKFVYGYNEEHALFSNAVGAAYAAKVLGISPGTVKNMCRDGRIPAKKVAGRWMIDKRELKQIKL